MTTSRTFVSCLVALLVLCTGGQPATWPSGPQTSYAYTHVNGRN